MQFRDVFSVDGKPVRDRSERLMQLFVSPTASTASQAERISGGKLARTTSATCSGRQRAGARAGGARPREPATFRVQADRESRGIGRFRSAAASAATVRVIGYREVEPQTMFDHQLPRHAVARKILDRAGHGALAESELIAQNISVRGAITVGDDSERRFK